jgi:ABC-type glycerol-3-phosphate transport system permease component
MRQFWRHELFWPGVLIVVGVYFLLRNVGLIDWLTPEIVLSLLIIALGVWLIVRRTRT